MAPKPDRPLTKHRPHPVSRAEFSRRAQRAASSVSEACAGPLKPACLSSGRIDAAHPAAIAWATKRGIDPASLLDPVAMVEAVAAAPALDRRRRGRPTAASKAAAAAAEAAAPDHNEPARIDTLLDMPLREILDRHQSLQGFGDWLDRRKKIASIAHVEFNTALQRNLYVPRQFVSQHIFGLIESLSLRLLTDFKVTATATLFNLAKSGASIEEGQRALCDLTSQQLKFVQQKVGRLIRDGKGQEKDPR